MKVLLTGANGFVGSHILDALISSAIPTAILVRRKASLRHIQSHLSQIDIRWGAITDPETLTTALRDVTHVIHCAGLTKAVHPAQFLQINRDGTRLLVDAINSHIPGIQRLVFISTIAASHPATSSRPASENDPPQPVTEYGRSKLAAENHLHSECRVPWVILRPSAVYGPRDTDFFHLFRAVRSRFAPRFGGGRQELSLVFAPDLAKATIAALRSSRVEGQTFNIARPGFITSGQLTNEIARQLHVRPFAPSLPVACLWPLCAAFTAWSRLTGQRHILSLDKFAELTAPGWVCRVDRLQTELGFTCSTSLETGIARTLDWYRTEGWL